MYDHLGIVVTDLGVARSFYNACLHPLGIRLMQQNTRDDGGSWLVYGTAAKEPFFVVACGTPPRFWSESNRPSVSPIHVCFSASSTDAVDGFYDAALKSGGVDNGRPGERRSSTYYYAAYVIDPDGNNVEAGYRKY